MLLFPNILDTFPLSTQRLSLKFMNVLWVSSEVNALLDLSQITGEADIDQLASDYLEVMLVSAGFVLVRGVEPWVLSCPELR